MPSRDHWSLETTMNSGTCLPGYCSLCRMVGCERGVCKRSPAADCVMHASCGVLHHQHAVCLATTRTTTAPSGAQGGGWGMSLNVPMSQTRSNTSPFRSKGGKSCSFETHTPHSQEGRTHSTTFLLCEETLPLTHTHLSCTRCTRWPLNLPVGVSVGCCCFTSLWCSFP